MAMLLVFFIVSTKGDEPIEIKNVNGFP